MPFKETGIDGLILVEPQLFKDSRGYFYESYNRKRFEENGIDADFVQDNQSKSAFGTLRGLHYQLNPFAQAKLVRVLEGEVLDVVVDIRKSSPTYRQTYSVVLSAENHLQLFIPRGFAHGFVTLSETAVFFYKCDNFYSKDHEAGIIYDDKELDIDWQLQLDDFIISEKDRILPSFASSINNFD